MMQIEREGAGAPVSNAVDGENLVSGGTGIFDSHAHYDSEAFEGDRDELLAALPGRGIVGVVNCGSDLDSSRYSIQLAQKFSYFYAAVGVHPQECGKYQDFASCQNELSGLAGQKKVVAIGEIGLDYHYDCAPREVQKAWFEQQIMLAKALSLPVIVHDREAHEDTMKLLRAHRPQGVVHCFSGSVEMAREVLSLGMYIGLGGAVTFKNAKTPPAVAAAIPLDRLLLETDAPYMTPVPRRGKRCDSTDIRYTAARIAELRACPVEMILQAGERNARDLFAISV